MIKYFPKRNPWLPLLLEKARPTYTGPLSHPSEKKNISSSKDVLWEETETQHTREGKDMKGSTRVLWGVPVRKCLGFTTKWGWGDKGRINIIPEPGQCSVVNRGNQSHPIVYDFSTTRIDNNTDKTSPPTNIRFNDHKDAGIQTSEPQARKAFSSLKAFRAYVPKLSIPSSWPAFMISLYSAAESSRLWYSSHPSSPEMNGQSPPGSESTACSVSTHIHLLTHTGEAPLTQGSLCQFLKEQLMRSQPVILWSFVCSPGSYTQGRC